MKKLLFLGLICAFAFMLFGCAAPMEDEAAGLPEEVEEHEECPPGEEAAPPIKEAEPEEGPETAEPEEGTSAEEKPLGIMFMIEYQDTVGLSNFVNEMEKREIPGLLMVTPEFVNANCEDIKELIRHDVEIVACNVDEPFWDVPYEEQKERIEQMTTEIENCTGEPVRIVSSRYFASDMNTVKAAEELGIPYVTARGTTTTKATVYQPEGYNVSILSVSNIPLVTFEYGSLCDYSFFERAGTPEDMRAELDRAVLPLSQKEKERYGEVARVTPVSHTRIGGYLEPWMDMWLGFWGESDVKWVGLDEIMEEPDWELPLWQVPINRNAPYNEEKIRPLVSYEEEEKVQNPCAATDIGPENEPGEEEDAEEEPAEETGYVENKLVMFHNGKGPMCIEALQFIETIDYPVEQHLDTEEGFREDLDALKETYGNSEGISESYGYFPIIFVEDKAYSGFNEEIEDEILAVISE
ncbi:hypothetical protein GF412_04980 [Candidatus Micrarchaeota archaeon]|nr:hypothetical protein [Candidatus Micrarchaeota archaeon]MBD3418307.1 hypothetical protein [Candidatus Micrarchaeota archaeon]